MKLTNEMTVPAPIDEAWALMLDVERVAPCLPGASITGSEGDEYKGTMKVKIGPIVSIFKGTLKIDEVDEEAHRAVLSAKARDSRGKGSANATITSSLEPAGEGTHVTVETELRVTGPAASFGRGVMQDVSAMLMGQFADCLATKLGREDPAEAGRRPPTRRRQRPRTTARPPARARRSRGLRRCRTTFRSRRRRRRGSASRCRPSRRRLRARTTCSTSERSAARRSGARRPCPR